MEHINLVNINYISNYIIPNSDGKVQNTRQTRQKLKREKNRDGRTPNELVTKP